MKQIAVVGPGHETTLLRNLLKASAILEIMNSLEIMNRQYQQESCMRI